MHMSFQGHFWIRKGLAPSSIIWILFDYFFSNKKGTFYPFHDVGGTCPPCPPCPHAPHAPLPPMPPMPPPPPYPPVPTPLEKMIEQNTGHHISLECQAAWHLLHQTPAGALRWDRSCSTLYIYFEVERAAVVGMPCRPYEPTVPLVSLFCCPLQLTVAVSIFQMVQ